MFKDFWQALYINEAGTLETSFTDHYLGHVRRKINFRLRLNKQFKYVETGSLSQYDKKLFLADLQAINWKYILDGCNNDPTRMAELFSSAFSSILDVHAPLKCRRMSKKSTPWITYKVKQLMRERDRLKNRATMDSTLWPSYKVLRNKVTNELCKCVQQYYHKIVKENCNDPKEMWKTVNKVLNKDSASSAIPIVNFQDRVLDRPNEIAKAFNEHFVTVGPKLASSIDHKANDDPLKYLKGTDENVLNFNSQRLMLTISRRLLWL